MRAGSVIASSGRHVVSAVVQAFLIVAIIAALVFAVATVTLRGPAGAGSVLAGSPNGSSWIKLAGASTARSTLSLGSSVSFDTGYPTNVKNPRIEVLCYQDGSLTYGEAGGVNEAFRLGGGGSIWLTNGGSADCTANLFYFGSKAGKQTYNKLASTDFVAN